MREVIRNCKEHKLMFMQFLRKLDTDNMSSYERNFKYTQDGRHLTEAQRQFYEDNGYLIFRKLISEELIDECLQRFLDICDRKIMPQENIILIKDLTKAKIGAKGEDLYYKINDILYDDVMYRYASNPEIIKIVSSIIGPEITATHSMLINKPSDSSSDDSRHPLHQDQYYFPFQPSENVVTVWTAMQTVNEDNGCLFAIPASHKWNVFPHNTPQNVKNVAYHGVEGFDHIPTLNFDMEKGDTVFFHPVLLHGSGPNRTNGFRRAISVHYANTNCEFYDVKGTGQEDIGREIVQAYAKKGVHLVYQDIWKYKGRLISGPPGNFQRFVSRL